MASWVEFAKPSLRCNAKGCCCLKGIISGVCADACRGAYTCSLPDSLLAPAAGRGDLGGAHEVTNVLLQKLVVVVELVVLLADGLDAVEDGDEGLLQRLCMSATGLASTSDGHGVEGPHLRSSSLASLPILSMSSLVLRGLMARTSSGPK